MHPPKLLPLVVFVSFAPQLAFAQYRVGDTVIVIQNTDIKIEGKALQELGRGIFIRVNAVNGDWLWVSHKTTGWISKNAVTDPASAIEVFTEQIRQNPNDSVAHCARGNVWYAKNEIDTSIGDFTEAIRLNPRNDNAFEGRGNCWKRKGEIDKAIADYSESIRLNPSDPITFSNRAKSWNLKGEYMKAVSDASEAIRIAPKDAGAYSARAAAWAAQKQFDMAVADCEEARKINSKGLAGYNGVAWLLATFPDVNARDGKKAIEFAIKACELTDWNDAGILDTLATAYAESGDFQEAVKWATKAVEMVSEKERHEVQSRLDLFKARKPFRVAADK